MNRSKFKAFADNTLNVAKLMISLFDTVENTVGKGENAAYQHFLLFLQCCEKPSSLGLLKVWIVSLPNNKILHWSKLKAFADDKVNVTKELKFILGREENFVGKRENGGYQHFLLFPKCFQMASFTEVLKSLDCVVKG